MLEIGQEMEWHKVVSNYGHVRVIPVTVLKIGKRITVLAPLRQGGFRKTVVTRDRLMTMQENQNAHASAT